MRETISFEFCRCLKQCVHLCSDSLEQSPCTSPARLPSPALSGSQTAAAVMGALQEASAGAGALQRLSLTPV